MMLAKVLAPKLKDAGVKKYRKTADRFAEHIIANGDAPFSLGSHGTDELISISFDDEDYIQLEKIQTEFFGELPDLIERVASATSDLTARSTVRHWRENRYLELRQLDAFRINLEDRWGDGLDFLRVLLSLSLEIGQEFHERLAKSRARKNRSLRVALSRLHIRACQVAREVLVLLENGLADGAMARWRTLHEIATVALVIDNGGDGLAKRYLAYDIVEQKKALDQYIQDHEALGYAPPSVREAKRTNAAFEEAIKEFGSNFGQPYGWAAEYLTLKTPRFVDIQKAAGRAMMQSHYKMASYNVHATPRALSFRLGSLNQPDFLVAGSSNAGIDEPGQNLAFSLVQITSKLCDSPSLDDIVAMKTLVALRDKAVEELIAAAKRLVRDDREVRRVLNEQGVSADVIW